MLSTTNNPLFLFCWYIDEQASYQQNLKKGGDEKMKWLHMLAFVLTVVGGLNWGLVGLLGLNLVNLLFGGMPALEQLVYILVGISALYLLATHSSDCKTCMSVMKGKK